MWDMTCTDTFAPSFLASSASEAGAVAALAEERKIAKYQHLDTLHMFVPFAVETTGVYGPLTRAFLKDIGRRVFMTTEEHEVIVRSVCSHAPAVSLSPHTVCVCNHPER